MDIALVFSFLMQLKFNAQFAINNEMSQDYFLFTGKNSSLHLFRNDRTVMLVHMYANKYLRYRHDLNETAVYYEWPLILNGESMIKLDGDESLIGAWEFSSFIFIDPLVVSREEEVININEDLPYEILVGILTIFVLITKLPDIITVIKSRIRTLPDEIRV